MTISQDIRNALQTQAESASGFPAAGQRAYEGVIFEPTVGTAWARMTMLPAYSEPSLSGDETMRAGIFQVDLYFPAKQGTGYAEEAADNLREAFRAGTRLRQGAAVVQIVKVEQREPADLEADWTRIIVDVDWRCYSSAA